MNKYRQEAIEFCLTTAIAIESARTMPGRFLDGNLVNDDTGKPYKVKACCAGLCAVLYSATNNQILSGGAAQEVRNQLARHKKAKSPGAFFRPAFHWKPRVEALRWIALELATSQEDRDMIERLIKKTK